MVDVAVLIPGIMGSELILDGELVWPGTISERIAGFSDERFARLLDGWAMPGRPLGSYSFFEYYDDLADTLLTLGFDAQQDPPTLYPFGYDWRRSNVRAAEALAERIEHLILAQHGPDVRIHLIAHSMGGLVARYFLESGEFDQRPGWGNVRTLITIATPHFGAPESLSAILGLAGRLFLTAEQSRQLTNHPDYPAAYELLPPAHLPIFWIREPGLLGRSLDDLALRMGARLNNPHFEQAKRFRAGLDLARRPGNVRYFAFYGTPHQTPTSAEWSEDLPFGVRLMRPASAGDNTVPLWSSTPPELQSCPLAGKHETLYNDRLFRRTLASLFGQGVFVPASVTMGFEALAAPALELEVDRPVYRAGDLVEVLVKTHAALQSQHQRTFQWVRVEPDETAVGEPIPITVGPLPDDGYDRFSQVAPSEPGAYELRLLGPEDHIDDRTRLLVTAASR